MRIAITLALLFFAIGPVQAHSYRIGDLEIIHPAMVPQENSDCTCAHVTIVNHGSETEYFLGADIEVASDTRLLHVARHELQISSPSMVPIAPGATLDLHRHEWCLFLINVPKSLEADIGAYPAHLMFRRAGTIDV